MFQSFHRAVGEARAAEEAKWGSARGWGGAYGREGRKVATNGEGTAMNFHGKLEMERMSNLRMDGCEARPELCGEGADVSIRNRSLGVWGKKREARCSRSTRGNGSPRTIR